MAANYMVFNISRQYNERQARIRFFRKLADAVPYFRNEIQNSIDQIESDERCDVYELKRKCAAMFDLRPPFEGRPNQLFCNKWEFVEDGVNVQLVKIDLSKYGVTIPCDTGW